MRQPRCSDEDQGVEPATMEIMPMLWRWRSKAQDGYGHIMSHIFIACDVYRLCILFCLERRYHYKMIPSLNFKIKVLSLSMHRCQSLLLWSTTWQLGVIDSTFTYNGCKSVLHTKNTWVKLDEASMYRHGLGTLETKRSNMSHIIDMINMEMFTIDDYLISRDDRTSVSWFGSRIT